ncbi:MAG TPA: hypothetical protein VJ124_06240 [Pyrinomonadaceae bacterium]|nr:hypothetical protein [Pyrinomonadaceae bacterium]
MGAHLNSDNLQKTGSSSFVDFASNLLIKGTPPLEVVEKLQDLGLDREKGFQIVNQVLGVPKSPLRAIARRNMMSGIALFVVGLGITICSYITLSAIESGILIVFAGAIILGLALFFVGLGQYHSKNRLEQKKAYIEISRKIYGVDEP